VGFLGDKTEADFSWTDDPDPLASAKSSGRFKALKTSTMLSSWKRNEFR